MNYLAIFFLNFNGGKKPGGSIKMADSVPAWVPCEFVVVPQLLNPHVGRHDLVPQVLQNVHILDTGQC